MLPSRRSSPVWPASATIASRRIATALFMAQHLSKPVLVEGVAGVGKTELAIATSTLLDLPLIRMQCYEGLDESKALYEWKYGKQLLYTQILKDRMGESLAGAHSMEAAMDRLHGMGDMFFSEPFMEPRPILKALQSEKWLRAADRRDRQERRGFRGLPAGSAVGVPGFDPRDRHHQGQDPAAGVPHLEQRARPGRCLEAPLPAPAHPAAGRATGRAHRRHPCAGRGGQAYP
ncbi:MAG: hypothetical protein WDM85_00540 [Caulobacteraceae bacterium]